MVLVMNMATQQMVSAPLMRTGNTPVQMALTADLHYLIVGNDNSQIATVLDLNLLQPVAPILFPFGHYPRSIGVANGAMFATVRNAGTPNPCSGATPPAFVDQITFAAPNLSVAATPCTLNGVSNPSIYSNSLPTADAVIAPSPANNYLMLALASGDVVGYDTSAQTWNESRKDFSSLGGAYGSFTGFLGPDSALPLTSIDYVAGPNMLDLALAPLEQSFSRRHRDQLRCGARPRRRFADDFHGGERAGRDPTLQSVQPDGIRNDADDRSSHDDRGHDLPNARADWRNDSVFHPHAGGVTGPEHDFCGDDFRFDGSAAGTFDTPVPKPVIMSVVVSAARRDLRSGERRGHRH